MPPIIKKQPGRPKKKRNKTADELPRSKRNVVPTKVSRKKLLVKCSRCLHIRHTKRKCKGECIQILNYWRYKQLFFPILNLYVLLYLYVILVYWVTLLEFLDLMVGFLLSCYLGLFGFMDFNINRHCSHSSTTGIIILLQNWKSVQFLNTIIFFTQLSSVLGFGIAKASRSGSFWKFSTIMQTHSFVLANIQWF